MIDTVTEKPPQDPPLDQAPAPTVSDEPTEKSGSVRTLLSTIGILLLAPLIAIFLTLFVFQSYQVDGPSMETTLQNNDRLIVWKLPRTWARITGHQYVPSRGDIIILNESGLTSYGSPEDKRQLVKRVVALPGERVVIKDNVLTVYNRENPDGFQPDATLPYGKNGSIPPTTNNAEFTLSATELFVCGDNRPNSLDSRTFGPIQTSQVVGKLVARILPLSNIEKF
jgi:signal peptidase I